jgi:hypothetical protein
VVDARNTYNLGCDRFVGREARTRAHWMAMPLAVLFLSCPDLALAQYPFGGVATPGSPTFVPVAPPPPPPPPPSAAPALVTPTVPSAVAPSPGSALPASRSFPRMPRGHRRHRGLPPGSAVESFGPALKAVPKFDVSATCRRAGSAKNAYRSCLDDELRAQKELSHKWLSFHAGARARCSREIQIGGSPSYVELLTCLELGQPAAQGKN